MNSVHFCFGIVEQWLSRIERFLAEGTSEAPSVYFPVSQEILAPS
jgi:hypothetical protein